MPLTNQPRPTKPTTMQSFNVPLLTLAEYIISLGDDNRRSSRAVTHLKLQKLIYFINAFTAAKYGRTLIYENFEAWDWGPVCQELYNAYVDAGGRPLALDEVRVGKSAALRPTTRVNLRLCLRSIGADAALVDGIMEVVTAVWHAYGDFSGPHLESLAAHGDPYVKARAQGQFTVISGEDMHNYFKLFFQK